MLPFIRDVRRLASRRATAGLIGFTSRRKASALLLLMAAGIGAGTGGLTCPSPAAEPGPEKPSNGDNKAPADTETQLAKVLQEWEHATRSAREFHYTYTSTTLDPVFNGPPEVTSGEVFISRPHRLRLEHRDAEGKPDEMVLGKDGQISLYNFKSKSLISVPWERPADVPGAKADSGNSLGLLGLLHEMFEETRWIFVGFPVADLKAKFVIRLEKEDEHWTYLRLAEKKRSGWSLASTWHVVLAREGRWVRRIRKETPPHEFTLDFTEPQQGPIPPRAWEPPFQELPKGWKADPIGPSDPPAPKGSPKGREGPR
jgi:hypothetical protein